MKLSGRKKRPFPKFRVLVSPWACPVPRSVSVYPGNTTEAAVLKNNKEVGKKN